jgi:hypothetical protein
MDNYFGGILAKPRGVRIKDNSTGVWGFGRSAITSVSLVADSIYDQVVPEIYTDSAMPVNAKIALGREESDFYAAVGTDNLLERAAGTAFVMLPRADAKGIQLSRPGEHAMEVTVAQGLSGWVWTAPGVRSQQVLTNPIWIAINMLLRARGLRFADAATCEQFLDVEAAIASTPVWKSVGGTTLWSVLSVTAPCRAADRRLSVLPSLWPSLRLPPSQRGG